MNFQPNKAKRMTKKNIPFFNYPALFAEKEQAYSELLVKTLKQGHYIMGPELAEFEKNLADYLGVKHVIGMADGTQALIAGCKAAGFGPGDEVIVSAHTFVASAAAIHHVGATPILADCGRDHLITAKSIRKVITNKTKGIMPVQLNGRTANMDEICSIANEFDLKIVEDSCQALGSKFKGKFAGTFGVAGTCSFYPSKTLGCFGDGGAVYTDDDEVAEVIKMMRDHGRGSDGKVRLFGYNARLDNIQAVILNFKLSTYDDDISKRRSLARLYNERLSELPDLLLPIGPDDDDDHFDIYQNYEIESSYRDELQSHLAENGVGTIQQWGGNTLQQFNELKLMGDTPYAEKMTNKFMMLPLHAALSFDEVNYICDKISKFYIGKLNG